MYLPPIVYLIYNTQSEFQHNVVEQYFVSAGTFGVMKSIPMSANHQIRHQATLKVGSQTGRAVVGMYGLTHFISTKDIPKKSIINKANLFLPHKSTPPSPV